MEFKDALRSRRLQLGLSPQQLANLITRYGSPTTGADIELWERGRNIPPLELPEFRQALAAALQTSVEKIERGMRLSLKAAELEPPQPMWSMDAIRAAEMIESMTPDVRQMALTVLSAMLNQTRTINRATDFWDS